MAPPSRRPAGRRRKPRRSLAARLRESAAEGPITVVAAAAYRPGSALVVCGAVVVVGAADAATLVLGGGDPAPLTAHYSGTATWDGGFAGRYVIRNGGESAVSHWKLTFTLPKGATVSSLSNARYTVAAGRVTAVPSHGLLVLALTDERGNLVRISAARPGRSSEVTTARLKKITANLREAGLGALANLGFTGLDDDPDDPDDPVITTGRKAT